jgi:hypothetical protein
LFVDASEIVLREVLQAGFGLTTISNGSLGNFQAFQQWGTILQKFSRNSNNTSCKSGGKART